jgi:hypothetical protein
MKDSQPQVNKSSNRSAIGLLIANGVLFLLILALLFGSSESNSKENETNNIAFSFQYISEFPSNHTLEMNCDERQCEKFTNSSDTIETTNNKSYVYLKQHNPVSKEFLFYTNDYRLESRFCNVVNMDHIDLEGFSDDSIKCNYIFRND